MSQFRKDPVSGEWVIIAPERAAKRPKSFAKNTRSWKSQPKTNCPFEDLQASGNWPPIVTYEDKGRWQIAVLENKYPALAHAKTCPTEVEKGLYREVEGIGHHELLVTRDHRQDFASLPPEHAFRVLELMAERYSSIDKDKCMTYVSAFGNWGPAAGASLAHPHYQLMALPVVPPGVAASLRDSEAYFRKNRSCIHCEVIRLEKKAKLRVIKETSKVIAFAPFASRKPYEVQIFPKGHAPFFESSSKKVLEETAEVMQKVLQALKKKAGDPDYNFYIHSAPVIDQSSYGHYHWHIEIAPRMGIDAGFELATNMTVNVVPPEKAAKLLR